MKIITGHISAETAYEHDYPYGRLRCIRRIWIETRKNFGQRIVYQTANPKKPGYPEIKHWNAVKPSNYWPIVVLYLEEGGDGFVKHAVLNVNDSMEKIEEFFKTYAEGLTDKRAQSMLKYLRVHNAARIKREEEKNEGS